MPSESALKTRVKRLQKRRSPKMYPIEYYDCVVDGKHQEMNIIDIMYAEAVEHKTVLQGAVCRLEYKKEWYNADFHALDEAFEYMKDGDCNTNTGEV